MPTFIGLDLAWTTKNESGICWLEGGSRENLRCTRVEAAVRGTRDLADEIAAVQGPVVVTIDAPLLYSSRRIAESKIASMFGKYKASAYHPSLAVSLGYTAGIDLGEALRTRGFSLDPGRLLTGDQSSRFAVEVFPHTIHVRLFQLKERLLYKKGKVAQKRLGLEQYQKLLRSLIERECPRVLEHPDVVTALDAATALDARGRALKRLDDTLDGLTCAIAAWLMWNQPENWEQVGDLNGYIVVPRVSEAELLEPPAPSAFGTSPAERGRKEDGGQALLDPDVTVERDPDGIDILVESQEHGSGWKVRVRLEGDDLSRVVTVVERLE